MTNAEAWFNKSLRPRKPEGSLGRTAQDGHLDSHTAPELCVDRQNDSAINSWATDRVCILLFYVKVQTKVIMASTLCP